MEARREDRPAVCREKSVPLRVRKICAACSLFSGHPARLPAWWGGGRDLGGERREDWPGLASWLGRQLEGWPRMLGGASVVAVVVSSRAS